MVETVPLTMMYSLALATRKLLQMRAGTMRQETMCTNARRPVRLPPNAWGLYSEARTASATIARGSVMLSLLPRAVTATQSNTPCRFLSTLVAGTRAENVRAIMHPTSVLAATHGMWRPEITSRSASKLATSLPNAQASL